MSGWWPRFVPVSRHRSRPLGVTRDARVLDRRRRRSAIRCCSGACCWARSSRSCPPGRRRRGGRLAITTDACLPLVLLLATVAALIGDLVTFAICRFGGQRAVRWVAARPARRSGSRRCAGSSAAHGWQIVVVGRLLPAGPDPGAAGRRRAGLPVAAAAARRRRRRAAVGGRLRRCSASSAAASSTPRWSPPLLATLLVLLVAAV